jgi:hypothetical protein
MQHIPKPFAYNLFFEIQRLLAPNGFAVIHLLSFANLAQQQQHWPWKREIDQQVGRVPGEHWHHFYSADELRQVLTVGTGYPHVHVHEHDGIWVCVRKTPLQTPKSFNLAVYKFENPDVVAAGVDPTQHFTEFGYREGRKWR